MITEKYPDNEIHEEILKTFLSNPDLELKLVDCYQDKKSNGDIIGWTYVFRKNGSLTDVTFSLMYPDSHGCGMMFVKDENTYFAFPDFLKQKSLNGKKEMQDIYDTFPVSSRIFKELELVKKYLYNDLKKVARGEEWLDITFDRYDH